MTSTTTFNIKAAEQNLMQAIYAYAATRGTPLTPENCQGELSISEKENTLLFETNDLAEVLAPMLFARLFINDVGSRLHADEPGDDGCVAELSLRFGYKHYGMGSNGCQFADVRFSADGKILEITLAEDEHNERMTEDERYAKRFA